ncbi:MAG: hypothetical protein P4L75_04670 [Clostridia bacterium]|nr:hypothetical protein [Clostridia bacterium]
MAEIIKSIVDFSTTCCELLSTAATGSDYFVPDNADHRVTLIIKNANSAQNATVTVMAGNGKLAACGNVAVSVSAGKTVAVPMSRLESARVKTLSGSDAGKVFVGSSVDTGGSLASLSLAVLSVL